MKNAFWPRWSKWNSGKVPLEMVNQTWQPWCQVVLPLCIGLEAGIAVASSPLLRPLLRQFKLLLLLAWWCFISFLSVWTYFSAMAITAALEVTDWTSLSLKVWDGFVWVDLLMLPFHPSKHSYDNRATCIFLGIPTKPTSPEGPHSSSGAFLRWWLHQLFGLPSFDAKDVNGESHDLILAQYTWECHLIFFWDGTIQDLLHCKHLLEGSMQVSVRAEFRSLKGLTMWFAAEGILPQMHWCVIFRAFLQIGCGRRICRQHNFLKFQKISLDHLDVINQTIARASFANKNIFWDSWVPSRPIIGWWSLA